MVEETIGQLNDKPEGEPNAKYATSDSDIGSGVARLGGDINCTST